MHALFEEAGKFMAGRILSEADTSAQVELDSGKRVKVKAANILLKFEKPAPAELIAQAQAVANQRYEATVQRLCGENAGWMRRENDVIQCYTHRGAKTITVTLRSAP